MTNCVTAATKAKPDKKGNTIKNIQVLRALAALLVIFVHLDMFLKPLFGTADILSFGSGVDIFFVISGFIMVKTTANGKTSAGTFLIKRLLRIAPLYWSLTLAVFLVALVAPSLVKSTSTDPMELIKSLLFIPFRKSNGLTHPNLFVGWTINYEMFFYLLFSLGLLARKYWWGLTTTLAALAGLVIAGQIFSPQETLPHFYTAPIIIEFALGMLIVPLLSKLPQNPAPVLKKLTLLLCLLALAFLLVSRHITPWIAEMPIKATCAFIVVFMAASLEKWQIIWKEPILPFLGDASYSIYLTHPFATQIAGMLFMKSMLANPAHSTAWQIAFMAGSFLSTIALGSAVYLLAEKPFQKIGKKGLSGWMRHHDKQGIKA